jgi:hypothetical protein
MYLHHGLNAEMSTYSVVLRLSYVFYVLTAWSASLIVYFLCDPNDDFCIYSVV